MFKLAFWPCALGIIGLQVVSADSAIPRATALLRSMPIAFEPNAGRWDRGVKFTARAGDYRILLSGRGVVFQDSNHNFSVSPLHANPEAELSGDSPLPFRTSYFMGARPENWRKDVVNYSRVRYRAVYPGIDLVYYGSNRDLEYDFVVAPGADPNRIRLKFQGIDNMAVTADGDLVIRAGGARLVQRRPVVYQEQPGSPRREVHGKFKLLAKNVVGFTIAPYDRSIPLTIDPVLTYASLLGGSGGDAVVAAKIDKAGFVYLAGYVGNSDFVAVGDPYQAANKGGADIFVAKIDPNASGAASLVYFTYIGGSGQDIPTAMAIDGIGNVYVTGSTTSIDFPLAGTQPQSSLAGSTDAVLKQDAFVLKLFPAAGGADALYYGTYLGGGGLDIGTGIDVDANGAIYVIGSTRSTDFPVTTNAYQSIEWGPGDTFIAKIVPDSSTSLVYSSYLGGEALDEGRAIAVTPAGDVYLAAETQSATFPLAGNSYRFEGSGGGDIVVFRMDLTKSGVDSLLYTTYLGGTGLDDPRKLTLDAAGRVLLTGYTLSNDFEVTPDAYQSRLKGAANAFIVRLDLNAPRASALSYATYLGGSGGDVAYDIATDASGAVYVTGYTVSTDFPTTTDALQQKAGGGIDVFLTKLKLADPTAGALLYSTYLGSTGVHVGYGVAVTPDGNICVAGQTGARNISATSNSFQPSFAGGVSDGFVLLLSPNAPQ
jgi:hypothetical protein